MSDGIMQKLQKLGMTRWVHTVHETANADGAGQVTWGEATAQLFTLPLPGKPHREEALKEANEALGLQGLALVRADLTDDYDALALERDELKAELRKYEPSDGMMHKLLGLYGAIDDAAKLFEADANTVQKDWRAYQARIDAWLKLHDVRAARSINDLENPQNAYGLALSVEQEKVKLLTAAVETAITWLVTVKADQPASIIAGRARLAFEALQAVGK